MTIAQEHNFGFSPNSSGSAEFDDALNPLAFDDEFKDDLGLEDDDDVQQQQARADSSKPKRSNNRKGPANADKRATHNAIERARRESLNGRFMTLAEALPTMANIKRPSKAMIVTKALDFVYDAQLREHTLIKENNDLRREVDQLRARLGMPALPPPPPLPESRMATQSTMRRPKKMQSGDSALANAPLSGSVSEASVATSVAQSTSPAAAVVTPASFDANSPAGSAASPSGPASAIYESPHMTAYSTLFTAPNPPPPANSCGDSAPSPTDTVASSASPSMVNPFASTPAPSLPQASVAQGAPGIFPMLNPALVQAHLAGMIAPSTSASAPMYNPVTAAYLSNPALLYALQQQHQQHQQAQQQHQQLQQQQQQAQAHSPAAFGAFGAPADAASLWGASWGAFAQPHVNPQTVDGLSF
ncbi:hypothetical protein JCM1841_004047 [Sporobolomyces salmonicolor]